MSAGCCLVVNPVAGGGRAGRALPAVRGALEEAGVRHEACPSTSLEHAIGLAAAAAGRGEVVAAFGGDGLVGALAGAVARAGGVFAVIPSGRGNDFARALGVPPDPAAAARVLARGRTRLVDLIGASLAGQGGPAAAAAGGAPAPHEVVVAGSVYLGIPALAAEIAGRSRFPPGAMAYPAAALRAVLGWRSTPLRLELGGGDGTPVVHAFDGGAAVVANTCYFGAGMLVAPGADPGDGLLDVVYLRGGSRTALMRGLAKIRKGTHVAMPQVGTGRAAAVRITVGRATAAGADGEPLACAPRLEPAAELRLRALPGALRVIS